MRLGWGRHARRDFPHQRNEGGRRRETDGDDEEGVGVGLRLRLPPGEVPEPFQRRRAAAPFVSAGRHGVALAGPLQHGRHGRIAGLQMFGEAQDVQIGSIIQDCAAGGDADRAAQISHQVEEAGAELQALGGEDAENQRDSRRDRELLREAAERLREQKFAPASIMRNRRIEQHAESETDEPEHQQPAQIEIFRADGMDRNGEQLEKTGRKNG